MTFPRRVAWAALVAAFVLALVMTPRGGVALDADDLTVPGILVMGPVGAWICARRPGNPVGWLFLAAGTAMALLGWAADVVAETLASGGAWTGGRLLAAWFVDIAWFVVMALCVVYLPLLFPDGPLSPAWRRVTVGLAAVQSGFVVLASVSQVIEPAEGIAVPNPVALPFAGAVEARWGEAIGAVGALTLPVGLGLALICLVQRYRRGGPVERQQLRWFVWAAALLFATLLLSVLAEAVLPYELLAWPSLLLGVGLGSLPVACGVAILRHGLYAIDRIVSRTVSYAAVTLVVVGVYALVVTSVTRLLPVSSTLAVAGATLAAAAVVRPALRWVQAVVDRRFDRERVDAHATVDQFGVVLRSSVDPDAAASGLLGAVDRTLRPVAVGVWVRGVGS
jgi:hypothetical protein